jgi:hypothetical protein
MAVAGYTFDVLLDDLGDMACTQLNRHHTFTPASRARFHGVPASLARRVLAESAR